MAAITPMSTAVEEYMAMRIIEGALQYDYVISKRPDLKVGIDESLIRQGYGHLITPQPEEPINP